MRECPKDGLGSMLASVRSDEDYEIIRQMLLDNKVALDASAEIGKEVYAGAWIALNAIDGADVYPYSRASRGEVPDMKVNIPSGSPPVVFSSTASTGGVQFGDFSGNPQTTPFWFGYGAYGWRWAEVRNPHPEDHRARAAQAINLSILLPPPSPRSSSRLMIRPPLGTTSTITSWTIRPPTTARRRRMLRSPDKVDGGRSRRDSPANSALPTTSSTFRATCRARLA